MKAAEEFIKAMESNNIKVEYHAADGGEYKNEYIRIGFSASNFSGLIFHLVFDPEENMSVQMYCNEICKFAESKNLVMLQTVNALNTKYRWVTFFVSENGTVNANLSVAFTEETSEQLLVKYLEHFIRVVDVAYPILMKAVYA